MNKTEIINNALLSIGEDAISDIDSSNEPSAKVVKQLYEQCRKVVLSSADWPFVMTQERLIQTPINEIDPETNVLHEVEYNKDFPYVFAIPNNCLFVERLFIGKINERLNEEGYTVGNNIKHNYKPLFPTEHWSIQNIPQLKKNAIVCKYKDDVIIEYVKDLDETYVYSDLFAEALSLYLAYKLCMPVKKDLNSTKQAYQMYEVFMQKAEQRMLNEIKDKVTDFVPEMVRSRGDYYDYKRYK
jgi:hypothetical protein